MVSSYLTSMNLPRVDGMSMDPRGLGCHNRASTLLRSATPQLGVPRSCVPEAPSALLIVFSASGLFFYYSASFLTPISPYPAKPYNMGD